MRKLLIFALSALMPFAAHAFPAPAGEWEWPHTISWHDANSNRTDGVQGKESICISQKSSADYPKAQADSLRSENCRISHFQSSGNQASFKASCETMSFDAQYEKLSDDKIRFVQTIHSRKGRSYTAAGIMHHKNSNTTACAE